MLDVCSVWDVVSSLVVAERRSPWPANKQQRLIGYARRPTTTQLPMHTNARPSIVVLVGCGWASIEIVSTPGLHCMDRSRLGFGLIVQIRSTHQHHPIHPISTPQFITSGSTMPPPRRDMGSSTETTPLRGGVTSSSISSDNGGGGSTTPKRKPSILLAAPPPPAPKASGEAEAVQKMSKAVKLGIYVAGALR